MFFFFQVFLKKNDGTLLPLRPVVSGPIREKKEKPTSNNLVPAESSSSSTSSSSDSPLQIRSVSCSSVSAAEGRRGVAVVCERRVADKEEIEVTAFVTIAPFSVKMQSNLKTQVRLERRDEATGSRLWSHCVPSAEVRVTPEGELRIDLPPYKDAAVLSKASSSSSRLRQHVQVKMYLFRKRDRRYVASSFNHVWGC